NSTYFNPLPSATPITVGKALCQHRQTSNVAIIPALDAMILLLPCRFRDSPLHSRILAHTHGMRHYSLRRCARRLASNNRLVVLAGAGLASSDSGSADGLDP